MNPRPLFICLGMVLTTIIIVSALHRQRIARLDLVTVPPLTSDPSLVPTALQADDSASTQPGDRPAAPPSAYWERPPRPFPVVKTSERFEWTAIDGRTPDAIRTLANNPDMVDALTTSNQWTKRRQLIYVHSNFAQKAQAIFDQEFTEIILPGFDGEEFLVHVDHASDFGGDLNGSFTGTVAGFSDAQVVAGADGNYWSIGIDFEDRHYQIENREEGEWIISEIDVSALDTAHEPCQVERGVDDVGLE